MQQSGYEKEALVNNIFATEVCGAGEFISPFWASVSPSAKETDQPK